MSSPSLEESAQSLTDDELDIMREVEALNACGYPESEIKEMLAERWPEAQAIMAKLYAERQRLLQTDKHRMSLL